MCLKYKSLKAIFAATLLLASAQLFGQAVKNLATPVEWRDNNSVILSKMVGTKWTTFEYDIKSGLLKELKAQEPGTLNKLKGLIKEEYKNVTLSPDSSMIAFTMGNDLYSIKISSGVQTRYTFDGSAVILNGRASWVYYEEIFGRPSQYCAFWWSPDSKRLAFYRFDDSKVPMFPIYNSAGKHGSVVETHYPMAGDPNPKVKIGIAEVNGGKVIWGDFNPDTDQYFGTPFWTPESDALIVQWMNRDQNNFKLYSVSPSEGTKKEIYNENQKTWIEWIEEYQTGKAGLYMVRDFDLWQQIYYLNYKGGDVIKLTDGKYWGTKILDVDERSSSLYFSTRGEVSVRNDVYALSWKRAFDRKGIKKISVGDFNYTSVKFSLDKKRFVAVISNIKTPPSTVLVSDGVVKCIESSKGVDSLFAALPKTDMTYIYTSDGFRLPASIIWPLNMDRSKRYPVIFYIYGGPDSGTVMDSWKTPSANMLKLAEEGVIQVNIDHRASGHCGKKGINYVYRDLGHYEIEDYILWAKHFGALPFVDKSHFGITGFSYGGTVTLLALTDGAGYFQYGFAGGGVYDWSLYDSHYTERYMDTPESNPEGYKSSAVINKVSEYKGGGESMLYLSHGTGDDNVHMQNTIQLIDALQKEGKHFELMLYPGGMHGYRGYQNDHSDKEELNFWRKNLLNK